MRIRCNFGILFHKCKKKKHTISALYCSCLIFFQNLARSYSIIASRARASVRFSLPSDSGPGYCGGYRKRLQWPSRTRRCNASEALHPCRSEPRCAVCIGRQACPESLRKLFCRPEPPLSAARPNANAIIFELMLSDNSKPSPKKLANNPYALILKKPVVFFAGFFIYLYYEKAFSVIGSCRLGPSGLQESQ